MRCCCAEHEFGTIRLVLFLSKAVWSKLLYIRAASLTQPAYRVAIAPSITAGHYHSGSRLRRVAITADRYRNLISHKRCVSHF